MDIGVIFDIRVHRPWTLVLQMTPVSTGRVGHQSTQHVREHGYHFGQPCSRAVYAGSVYTKLKLWRKDCGCLLTIHSTCSL